ncbi:hypothetical protein SRHO_G00343640, partial [Serrasalmus rhombeus]
MTRFGRQPDESAAKLLFANRRRNRGERIAVLASEVALLVRQAYLSFPREAQQQLSLDHFVRALEPGELRMHVRLANPITINVAVDEATRAETILSGKGDGWDATVRPRVGPPDKKLTCWRCGEIGDKANTCTSTGNEMGAVRPDLLPDDVGEALALSGRRTVLTTVTGNRFELVGCVSVTLDFGHGPWTQSFWVGGIMDACILGGDFLERVGAVFDFGSGSLTLNGRRVAVHGGTEMAERPCTVAVRQAGSDTTAPFSVDPVRDLWERSRAGLSEGQGQLLWALLDRFRGIFTVSERECSRMGLAVHAIDTADALPVRLRPHRLPLAKRLAAEQLINEMAAAGVIEPSSSSWSAPVVLAKKKDGSWRFCVYYCRLNAVTRTDSYPVLRVDDTLERLAGSDWFSSLDLRSGYWQVPLADTAKEKTDFSIGTGLWQFTVLPFGLCNVPATFERLMERVLAGVAREKCVVYLDNVLVHAARFEAALANLELVLGLIKEASLSLNPAKCNLLQRRVSFLGHVVSGEGIATDPNKTAAVRDWPTPRTVRQVRSFLGFTSYYRQFVKGFAEIAAPLHRLTGGSGTKFRWSDEADRAFLTLKEKLCSTPVLAYPIPSGQFVVDTDASDHGLGAVLSQMQDGSERVIAYFSRRWLTRLQEFDYTAEHHPGRSHGNADALSRRPCTELSCVYCQHAESRTVEVGHCAAVGQAPFAPPTLSCIPGEELSAAQKGDPELEWALRGVETGLLPDWDAVVWLGPVAKAIQSSWSSMRVVRGILCRVWEDPSNGRGLTQAVVPRRLRDAVLQAVHGLPGSGHFGITKTLGRLRQRFWWPGCRADVELHVHCCDVCAAKKGPAKAARAPLQPMQSGSPMERVAVDVLGPFPVTDAGNRFIIVFYQMYFIKFITILPNGRKPTLYRTRVQLRQLRLWLTISSAVCELRTVLLGKNSSEISRVGNFILNGEAFDTEAPSPSVEQHSERARGKVEGRYITLINTPHLFDPCLSLDQLTVQVKECMSLCAPGPHVIVLVIQPDDFTETDRNRLYHILYSLSDEPHKYTLVLTTQKLQSGASVDPVDENVSQIITECSNRHFEFVSECRNSALVEMMEKILEENGGNHLQWEEYEDAHPAGEQHQLKRTGKEKKNTTLKERGQGLLKFLTHGGKSSD